jgi:hypothetical protein
MDHHVPRAVTLYLRSRGVDVLTAEQDGTSRWADQSLLDHATALGRVFVSSDADLLVIAASRQATGQPFSGLFSVRGRGWSRRDTADDLLLAAQLMQPDEMRDRIEDLPL